MAQMPSSSGRQAFVLTVLALLWSIGLLVAALVVPVYGSATLVDENGKGVLLTVGAPAIISLAVWFALWRKCTRGGRVSDLVAKTGVCLLVAFCVIALASIGLWVVPVALLLACATSLTPSASPGSASCLLDAADSMS